MILSKGRVGERGGKPHKLVGKQCVGNVQVSYSINKVVASKWPAVPNNYRMSLANHFEMMTTYSRNASRISYSLQQIAGSAATLKIYNRC
jgi:hypothetical protein